MLFEVYIISKQGIVLYQKKKVQLLILFFRFEDHRNTHKLNEHKHREKNPAYK